MNICIFGGQFGSEGKGAVAEYLCRGHGTANNSLPLVVCGDNSPNSGHTCMAGKTRNIPAASFWADVILICPDAVIDVDVLADDLRRVADHRRRDNPDAKMPKVIIHCNAALLRDGDMEMEGGLVKRIGSTGSGSGSARLGKFFARDEKSIVGSYPKALRAAHEIVPITIADNNYWLHTIVGLWSARWVFECSQGALLDTNFGYFPYVTSRSTMPRVCIERNGLGCLDWEYAGVYRPHPIRTGGNTGHTGGAEIDWSDIGSKGVSPEIASVTGRTRRVFEWSIRDFAISISLCRPTMLFFTHCDYLRVEFEQWWKEHVFDKHDALLAYNLGAMPTFASSSIADFRRVA